jgi:hypothetical protein
MATPLDLTPFGYTPTENIVYSRLLNGGPSSGYAVARDLVIARANAYQALRGLVAKGAAVVSDNQPQKFRAVRPSDLFASIVDRQTRRLDELEAQLTHDHDTVAESFVRLTGERTFIELAARTAARESEEVSCIGPPRVLAALTPSFRKRGVDGASSKVWALGDGQQTAVALEGVVPLERAQELFGAPIAILLAGSSAMLARLLDRATTGYWASEPDVVGATRGAFAALTAGLR